MSLYLFFLQPKKGRKNIKKLKKLSETTKAVNQAEAERIKRISERQKIVSTNLFCSLHAFPDKPYAEFQIRILWEVDHFEGKFISEVQNLYDWTTNLIAVRRHRNAKATEKEFLKCWGIWKEKKCRGSALLWMKPWKVFSLRRKLLELWTVRFMPRK